MSFEWNGDKILRKRAAASLKAVNQTMAAAVKHAKLNHPGWKNVPPAGRGWNNKNEPKTRSGDEFYWGPCEQFVRLGGLEDIVGNE